MISNLLKTLSAGYAIMRSNGRMVLVAVLVFVFPIIFIWITQSFFQTSYDNIRTANDDRLTTIHSSTALILEGVGSQEFLNSAVTRITAENDDIQAFRVFKQVEDSVTLYASNASVEEEVVLPSLITRVGFTEEREFIRTEFLVNNERIWQAASRYIDNEVVYYVFTEHNFKRVDSVMTARRQQSYFGLTAIFVFLITLAYWLNRQTDWHARFNKAEQDIKDRDMFSNMIAHEFRTPLTAIKGYASFLEESNDLTGEEKRFALNIRVSAERLVLLVNDFLEVARLQSGKLTIEKEPTSVLSVLNEVKSTLENEAVDKGLQLKLGTKESQVMLTTDKKRLIQVVTNITSNAIKYTDEGSITLECKEEKGRVVIYVKDTGTGISAEDQRKLFLPFSRVGGVDGTTITGSGLGMWITKHLTDLLGGTIGVESIKGIGTHVVISFNK